MPLLQHLYLISAAMPKSQLFGPTYIGTPGLGKKLALTYDDGPNSACTPELLSVLAKHGVRATFFLVGSFVEQRPDLVQQMASAGHEIGNHTHTHPYIPRITLRAALEELILCEMALLTMGGIQNGDPRVIAQDDVRRVPVEQEMLTNLRAIRQATGTRLFRAPFGARTPMLIRVARAAGYEVVQWSVFAYDWRKTTAARVERWVRRGVKGGDVILLHDGDFRQMGGDRAASVEATDRLVAHYLSAGYEFVTVSEMLAG